MVNLGQALLPGPALWTAVIRYGNLSWMKALVPYMLVGIAGFFGAISRMLIGQLCGHLFNTSFPVATMIINLSGSFLLGWVVAIAGRDMISEPTRMMLAVGFLGAYTTFSTFMLESHKQLTDGAIIGAGINLAGSILLGLIAIRMGMRVGGN